MKLHLLMESESDGGGSGWMEGVERVGLTNHSPEFESSVRSGLELEKDHGFV